MTIYKHITAVRRTLTQLQAYVVATFPITEPLASQTDEGTIALTNILCHGLRPYRGFVEAERERVK